MASARSGEEEHALGEEAQLVPHPRGEDHERGDDRDEPGEVSQRRVLDLGGGLERRDDEPDQRRHADHRQRQRDGEQERLARVLEERARRHRSAAAVARVRRGGGVRRRARVAGARIGARLDVTRVGARVRRREAGLPDGDGGLTDLARGDGGRRLIRRAAAVVFRGDAG